MRSTLPFLALAAVLAAPAVLAQETGTGTDTPPETATDAPAPEAEAPAEGAEVLPGPDKGGLDMGTPVAPNGNTLGTPYVKSEFQDWDIRCIRTEGGNDPCQLYQLLEDEDGNPVAEFTLFPLVPARGDAVAGGTIVAPLETLLTQAVTFAIDGGEARRYPFTFCTEVGCVARIGYAQADVDRFKRGRAGRVTIVPVVAPDQRIGLEVSLTGFTAAWEALQAEGQAPPAQ